MNAVGRFKSGFENFKWTLYNKNLELFEPLKTGQAPKYMVFACADSRVCPTLIFSLKPGEAFTVRNIASMVPAYHKTRQCSSIASAIEFAVIVLKVECIIVIGHSNCGGIRELLSLEEDGPNTFHFIDDWVKIGLVAKKVERENKLLPFDDQCTVLEKEVVNLSLRNLQSYPFVKERLEEGTLKLIGARNDFYLRQLRDVGSLKSQM
ncbi:hypothetical protein ABZP36_015958 [Zizania latifolia]